MKKGFIDLHTHSLLSDGALIPQELACRYEVKGAAGIAITDHADASNLDFVVPRLIKAAAAINASFKIRVIPGVEVSYVAPESIRAFIKAARALGARLIVVHGESPVEPVPKGTNKKAISAGCDILAHPGHIEEADVLLAREKGVLLEITTRKGHCKTNPQLIETARRCNARLCLNTDSHAPDDLITMKEADNFLSGLGLKEEEKQQIFDNSRRLFAKKFSVVS